VNQKIDEPLKHAWARALRHYGIYVGSPTLWEGQVAAAQRLFPIIMEGKNKSERFTEIFMAAPVWLLQFAGMAFDARVLKFQVPNLLQTVAWGTTGFEDMRRWPLLPLGTMMAGDPISNSDSARRMCIISFCQITVPFDLEDLLIRADEENCDIDPDVDDFDVGVALDLALALDLDRIPEEKWSRHEKRRMRKLAERFSRS
jgi:hypothetical protein